MHDELSNASPETQATAEPKATPAAQADQKPGASRAPQPPDGEQREPATVIVRGEAVADPSTTSKTNDATAKASPKPVSERKAKMRSHLPALDDDPDVGVQKDQVVVRDGKADLAFTGTLLASAAPDAAPSGQWEELRIYETSAEKFVFSKVTRHVHVEEPDEYEAEIFEPSPSSTSSQLLRSARDLTRSHPLTWKDAAVDFFGYEPLAKSLYRKLGDGFEERIS